LQAQFDQKLKQKDNLILEQANLLNERNKLIKHLQNELKVLENKSDSESKTKEDTIRQLKLQVEQQSTKIAELSFQIHVMSQKKFESSSAHQLGTDSNGKTSAKLVVNKSLNGGLSRRLDLKQSLIAKRPNETKHYIQIVNDKPVNTANRRDSISSGVSNDRPSKLQPIKAMPFEELRKTIKPLPDQIPLFMQKIVVTSNNNHFFANRSKNSILPPIKSASKLSEFAVDMPHKHTSFVNQLSDIQKN
jgi:hypothetical protein